MTSTNDGSNLKSGKKDKRYYIESFQSLEARLNGQASTEQRTRNVCEAWRLVHGLCSHSTPDTRSHLLSWIQRNTAYAILQDEWGLPENKTHHVELEKSINDFILECHETDTLLVWETTLLRRAVWYKGVLSNPWGHSVLKALLDPKSTQPTDQEVIQWLREERAMMFVTRVRVMARAKRLFDLALVLVSAVMTRARAPVHIDVAPGVPGGSKSPNFVETLSREAGFTKDVWELLMDIEFVLLHKQDQTTCIDLAKTIPLKDGKRIVERLRFRLDKSPADKKLWKKAKDVAILIAQVVITRCMVMTSCSGAVLDALTGCASALALLLDGSRLPQAAAALAAPAATAAHLYAFANAIAHQCKDKIDRQPFVCELYVRAITAGMNELERLKLEKDKEPEVCALQHTLSRWFSHLGEVLSSSARLRCECLLTAFSLHPSATMYERVAALPPIAAPDKSPKRETTEVTSEFGSWATDSRTSSNFVKTSETLNLKQTQRQTNILSSSMFDTECGALGLKTELCEDLAVLLSGPRVKTLSWDMDRETLLENCRVYMERTQEGTRALTTELKYLNLDPKSYDHLPEEEDDEDNYYGIEKGYEIELEYEDIWSDNNIEYAEGCESACSISTVDSTKNSTKPKGRKNPAKYSEDESDPLSLDAEPNFVQRTTENKKKTVKKQNDVIKKKSKPKNVNDPESKKLSESDQEKELLKKQKRKERRDRKKREKMEMLLKQELQIGRDDNLFNPTGTNIVSAGVESVKERRKHTGTGRTQHVSATDSDYDSQGKSSLASINSEGNDTDVLFGGLFSMDGVGSLEKTMSNNANSIHDTNSHRNIIRKQTDTQDNVKDKLKNYLQFRQQSNQVEKAHSASKINIVGREDVQSQIQDASPRSIICKNAEPENSGSNLKRSEKNIRMDASKSNVPANNAPKKTYVAPSRKKNQARAQAVKPGLLISDPHQLQFQEFLKRHNIPITNNANKQHPPTTTKEPQSQLAQRNPVLSGLIQQRPELHQHVNSIKDINKEPSNRLVNSEVQKLQQQNLSIVENKKNLPQKCGVDNAPNTFSRLSYMHKNKQADMKYKQLNEQMKTPISKIIDNDSLVKIKNLQAKGEICISKALKRNTMAISRKNPPPLIKQGERIPNPLTTAAVQPTDLRVNIVNVSKATKEIFENKVIIKKQQKATTSVDLQYLIHERNFDVGSNWKSQYPNTVIEKFTDNALINVGNASNEDKVVVLGVESDEPINNIAIAHENNVVVSHSAQYNNKGDIKVTPNIGSQLENSEDWKDVMNKLISLKSEKKGVNALKMALNRNSSIKANVEIFPRLPKNTANSKSIHYPEHSKMSSKQKGRTSVVDTKPNLTKNAIVIKTDQPNIKKVVKKSIPKYIDPTKSLANTNTLKTNNVIMPSMHNSDYDQLDDLIDDELRQEIEESSPLTSEVDIVYGPARVTTARSDKEKLAQNKSSQEIKSVHTSFANYNMEQSTRQSSIESASNPVTRTCSVIKENSQGPSVKPKLHIISDQILPPYTKSSGSKTEKYSTESNESRSSVVAMRPLSHSQKISCGVHNNNISVITSPINIVHPVIIRNVSNTNQVQNLMLITPTNIIPASTHQAPIVEQPKVLNVINQMEYVLNTQNTSLFSSPETVQVGNLSMASERTDLPKPNHQECCSDLLKSNDSKKHDHANAITEVISQSNLESHANIGANRLKGEELIKSHSINQTAAQHSDESLKINLEGHALPISMNRIKDSNINKMNLPFLKNQFQHTDETSNTIMSNKTEYINSNTEKKSHLKSEVHQNLADPKSVSNQIICKESKCEDISSKCDKRVEIQSNLIEFNPEIYNKEKVRSPSILSENYDQIMDTEFSTDMKDEVAKTGTLEFLNTKEGSPSILNYSFDRIVNTTDTKGELAKTETDENKKIARSPSILNDSSNQIMNTEFTTDMEGKVYKSKINNSEEEKGRSLFLLSDSCKQIIDQNFTTTVKNRSDITKKDDENSTDCRQSYKDAFKNAFEDCFEKSLDIDISSKTDKQTKLKQVICDPQEVNILNEATVSDLNVVTNKTFENENYLVTEMPKSYDPNLPQNLHEPIMTLSVYIPQKKAVDSATNDNMSTKFCERKVLSQVQEYELSKASEIIENKKSLNNKHPQDYKNRSDIERLRRKRLSIIHREINHYNPSEPIALMYAPIQFEKRSNNDEITQPKTSSQNNLISKTEERLKSDNESNAKVSVTNSEVVQLNSERCIKKSDNIPSRRLRSSNLFRTKERTTLDDSNINLLDSELQTNPNNVSEAKKTASKRILESSLSSDSFVTREKNNELLDNTHNIDANKKLKENTDRLEHVTANLKSVNNVADTIDLTDTEPIKELNLPVCGLLNIGPVTTSIPKIRQQVHTLFKDIRKKSLKKEVTVTDIKELPSPNGDVMKKILRIKLSNGNIFRATVSGNLKVDIRTILSEPSIKSILTTNVLNSKSCTVNVKHVIDSNNVPNKNILISSVVKRSNAVSTEVIELSDDEDENIYYFKTEFGTYKTKSIDSKAYEKHQNKLLEKCTVKIPKIDKNMTLNGLTESSQNIVLQNENVSITKISDVTNSCENSNYKIIDSSEKITEESEINSETPSLKTENILANLKDLESTLLKSQIVQLHNDCRVNLARCDQEMKLRDCGFNSANPFDEPKGSGDTLSSEENVPDKTSNSFSLSSDKQIKDEKHGDILRSFDLISCNSDWISGTKPTINSFELLQQKYLKSMYDVQTECNNLKMSSSSDALSNLSDTDCNDKSALRPDSPSIITDFESKARHNSYTFVQSFCNSDWMLYTKATIHSLEVRHQKYTKAEPISQVNPDINLDSSTDCDSDLELDGVRQEIEEFKISFQVPSLFNLVYTLITTNVDVLERYLTQNDKNFDIFNSPTHNLKRKLNTSDTRNNSKIFKIDSNVFEKQDIRKSKHTTIILDHPKFVDEAATQHYVLEARARHVNVKDTSADHAESVVKVLSLPKILWHGDSSNNDNSDTCEKNDSILKVRVTKENNLPNNIILEETQTYPIKSSFNKIQLIHNDQETKNSMKDLEKNLTPIQEFKKIIILDNKINVSNDRFNEAQSNNIISVSKALCAAEPSKNDSSDKCEENESNLKTLVYKKENVTTIQTSTNSQTLNVKNDSNHTQFECNDQESNSAMKYIESNKSSKAYITNSVNMFESDSNVAENADKNKDMNKEININNAVDHICAIEADVEIEKNESNEHTNPKVFEILNQGMSNSMPLMDSKKDDEIKLEYNQHILQEVVTNANVNNAVDRIRATEVDFEIEKNESNEDTNPKVFEILYQGMSNSMPLMDSKKDDEIKLEYNQHILQEVVTNANVNNAVDRIRATEVDFEIEKNESNENTNPKVFEILNQGMSNSMPLTDSEKDDEIKLEYNKHILQEVVTNANVNNAVDRIRATEVDFEIDKNESNEDTNLKVFEILNQGMSNSMPLMDSKKDDEIKLEYNQHILQEVVTNANVNNAVDRIRATEVDFEIEKNESNEDTNLKVFEILNQDKPNSMPLMDSKKDDAIKFENNQYILHKVVTNANDFSEKLVQGSENNGKNIDNGSTNDTIINETSENENASVGNNTIKLDDEENLFCATEDTLNYKKQKFSEESLVTTDVELSSKKIPKSSKFENVTTFKTTQACPIESKTIKIDTNIGHKIDLSKAPEGDNILNEDQSQLKSLEINNSQVNIIEDLQERKTSFRIQNLSPNKSNEVNNGNVTLNSTELSVTPSFSLECEQNNQENQFQKINKDENTSSISENVIENIRDDKTKVEKNKRRKNENDSVTLIYNGNSNVVLKGSPYVDPVVGTCYIFPLSSSSCNRKELTSLNANQTINMIKALKKKSINESDDTKDQSNFSLILPEITYSRPESNNANVRQLKRKSDTKNDCKLQKKYRKGKNIDACKQTSQIYAKIAYTSQYKRLLEYCTTIKFSYSRPFHKNSIDPGRLLKNWPIQDRNCDDDSTVPPLEECEKLIYHDINKENKAYFDPLQQTLAEEIAMEYNNEKECPQFDQTEDSNFKMGFGEGSDRVIQNLANGIFYTSKFSAATLSDVKLPQPYFTTRDKIQYVPQIIKKTNDEELAIMKRCISFIQLREKVKDFFKRSACELHCNWNVTKRSSKKILYELTSPQFLDPPTHEVVVNVVQVGQLPVSASAQNPVTCDPRVTHVSNASPPQCSAENSPDSDQNTSKTEYTELTTADLSLPLVQEYQRSSQVIMSSQSQLSVPEASKVSIDTNCENKEVEAKNDNTEESDNFLPDHKSISNISYTYNPENDSFKSGNNSYRSVNESYKSDNDSYKSDSTHKPEKKLCKPDNNALLSENSRTLDAESQNAIFDSLLKEDNNDYVSTPKTTNGTSEKTDQIAHAMNAAGITTGSDSINNNSRAHALANILSQKIRQNTGNTTQTSVNSYNKGSPINAMALQQALAQILPPPLNQTNSSDNQSTSLTPQVLHIVQGKNTSGNQITIVDNQPNSVINNSNNTPVLHIVQNKSSIGGSSSNSNSATQNNNSFSGLSLVDAGIQQGGNQLLHIVNTGGQKNSTSGQLLKRVNLLTNLTNVQGNNEQKMVQFVCKSADGKSIQLNAPHQRSMVLRLQPIEPTNVSNAAKPEGQDNINQSPNFVPCKENNNTQQEIKSRSVYEENYAKFIQNSSPKSTMPEKSTSLPKFNQAFGKQVFQDNNQKSNEMQSNSSSHEASTNSSTENIECSSNDNAINLENINHINSPPLLLRKSPAQTSQSQQGQSNLVQQIKQTIAPVNIQTMHGGVIYTRQIPVNIGGGQTINLITVPSTELMDESGQKQQGEVKFVNQNEIEQSIIKIVPQSQNSSTSESASEDNNALNASNDAPHTSSATHTQPVLTQMRIKLPMLSKTPQMVSGARLVRPSFFQIQRNVIGGANQPVYQQLVLTAAPSLGQQSVRPPQAQPVRVKTTTENQTSSESQMSSSTLEQLREFDMVLEQVKERSTVQPNSNTNSSYTKLQSPTETTESNTPASVVTTEPTQQVLYSIGNNNSLNVAYVNRKPAATTPTASTFARSPDSSGVADSPTSSTHIQIPAPSSSNETSSDTSPQQSQPKPKSSSKSKSRPKTSTNPTTSMKINTVPPKTSTQKPLEDEQTTQRILYILAEYKEQVENSPDKDKPAPRRRSNPPSNPGSSKRKKSSSGSRRPGGRDMSPIHGEDTCRTMGSEDSSCGTSQGDCTENCLESHSPQDSPRKVVRKLTFENETSNATPRQQPARNVIVADGQTITVARGTAGKPATAVLMPANYILPVSMVKGGQQIAIVTNRGPKILTVGGEGGGNALLLQRLIGPAGLKPVLARPGVRHVRLPTAALHNLQAFNIATATSVQPPDSTASPAPAPTPPDLGETRATGSPWPDRDSQDVKPERSSSPEGSEPWNLPSSADPHDYSYDETVRAENLDRTVLVVQKRDQRQHRLAHVSAAALRHKYAILEHELRLQKSLSEECEDLGVDSPSAAELFPEAELLFASSPAHESSHRGHTPQPGISQTIPQPDIDDQIATDQLLNRSLQDEQLDVTLGLDDGIVTVSEDGMQATITLDQEEFARSHPNTTFHSEPTEEENVQPYTISGIKGRHITSTIFHAGRAPATVLMTAPQTTVISQAADTNIKYIDNIINPTHNVCLSSVLVKDDGLTKYDNILNDSRELHLSNTASAIVHSNATQVIRRVCYDEDKNSRFLLDETDALIAGDDAKMIAEDSSRDATLESIADDRSSPERHTELFWESNSASERSDSRRPLDFSSDSDKCCKSPLYDETNSTDSSGVGTHMRLDSVIKDARGLDRSSADNSSADDTIPPLRTYPPKRMYHVDTEMERSVSGKTRAGERSPDGHEVRRRASVRGVVKRGCHCCNGSPAPPRPKKSRQKKPSIDFNN